MSDYIEGHNGPWEIVLGLEVHAQVISKAKLFSGAATEFGAEPNTQVSFVDAAFPGIENVRIAPTAAHAEDARHLYWVALGEEYDRNKFIAGLTARNIGTGVHYIPIHLHPYYQRRFGWAEFPFGEFRRAKSVLGGTVNDAVLTVIAGGMGRYLRALGQPTEGVAYIRDTFGLEISPTHFSAVKSTEGKKKGDGGTTTTSSA